VKRVVLPLTILLISLIGLTARAEQILIELHDATVTSPFVSLGQIARIISSDAKLVDRLSSTRVLESPLPGFQRRVPSRYILQRLASAGINPKSIKLKAPPEITIRRRSFKLKGEQILNSARENILKLLKKKGWEVKLLSISDPGDVVHPFEKVELKPGKPKFGMGSSIIQPVEIWSGRKLYRTIPVYMKVRVSGTVPTAARDMKKGERVSTGDVVERRFDRINLSLDPVSSFDQIRGKRLRNSIKAGEMLRLSLFERSNGLRPGDMVQVELQTETLIIRFPGRLISIGRSNEVIIVNPNSGKRLKGLLRGDRVIVRLGDKDE